MRAKHQRGSQCIYRDMTASELDRAIDTNAELLAALKSSRLMLYAWQGQREGLGLPKSFRELDGVIAGIEAVIEKAEGH